MDNNLMSHKRLRNECKFYKILSYLLTYCEISTLIKSSIESYNSVDCSEINTLFNVILNKLARVFTQSLHANARIIP